MRISRPLKLCAGCCWCASADCCSFSLFVEAPVGNPIGSIHQALVFTQLLLCLQSIFSTRYCFKGFFLRKNCLAFLLTRHFKLNHLTANHVGNLNTW